MQKEIYHWTGGAFVHTHARIEDALEAQTPEDVTPETRTYMERYTDGSMTLGAITIYLDNIFGQRIPITDTQHPSYVLSDGYDDLRDEDKIKYFNPHVVTTTIELLSRCILERMRLIRRTQSLNHVLSGVEADILSPWGVLSVNDEALAQLDYVTSSFHSPIWQAAGNPEPTKVQCLDTYQYVVANPHVDTISHPTINLPLEVKQSMTPSDWGELLQHMRERRVAFEVNLDSTNLINNGEDNLDRSLVVSALKNGVPVVIGFDFHYAHDWGCVPSPRIVRTNDASDLFKEHLRNGSLDRLLARVLGNIYVLKQLGFQSRDIVNNSQASFSDWLDAKNHNN